MTTSVLSPACNRKLLPETRSLSGRGVGESSLSKRSAVGVETVVYVRVWRLRGWEELECQS